jgi:hypothetical protein
MSRLSSAVLAMSIITIAIGTAPTAEAQRWGGGDASGDVHYSTYDPEPAPCGTSTTVEIPENTSYDITRLVVAHRKETVIVDVHFRDLLRRGTHITDVNLRTDGLDFLMEIERWKSAGKTMVGIYRQPEIPDNTGECGTATILMVRRNCPKLEGSIEPRNDVVTFTSPRSCLGNPRWIRAGADTYGFTDGAEGSYSDRWAPAGENESGWTGPYGPRVRRG